MSLQPLVAHKRILVCVGSGGVGKTTTAAALGLAGARAGGGRWCSRSIRRKRLANALGLSTLGHDEQRGAAGEGRRSAARAVAGTLDAMMLDQKRAFDEIVERYAKDPRARERIMGNRIYQQISSTLAGSHEYAAMAKLYEIAGEKKYDLIILDTPPTANALDFLDAPERLTAAIDSPAIQWFTKPYLAAGRFSLKAVGMGAAFVLSGWRASSARRSSTTWRSSSSSSTRSSAASRSARARSSSSCAAATWPSCWCRRGSAVGRRGGLLLRAAREVEDAARRVRGEPLIARRHRRSGAKR